jgi:hypothetical protein
MGKSEHNETTEWKETNNKCFFQVERILSIGLWEQLEANCIKSAWAGRGKVILAQYRCYLRLLATTVPVLVLVLQ